MHQPTLEQMFGGEKGASKCVEKALKRKTTKEVMEEIFGSSGDDEEVYDDMEVQESEDFDDSEVQEGDDELLDDLEILGDEPHAATSAGTAESKAKKRPVRKFRDEWARRDCGLELNRMVGIATDGDSSMLGCNDGLVTKLKRQIPHLLSIHCIAHREALAVVDAAKSFDCLAYIDKIANKIYSWISGSSLRHTGFQALLQEMNLQVLEVLQIHAVRWLARGNVMSRLTQLMPAILSMWQDGASSWYRKLRIYKVLFCIHMLADVLHEMNMLSKHFQADIIDVCSINTTIDVTMASLRRKFLQRDFGKGTLYLKKFMDDTESGVLQHVNEEGRIYAHQLSYERIPGVDKNGIPLDVFPGSRADKGGCIGSKSGMFCIEHQASGKIPISDSKKAYIAF